MLDLPTLPDAASLGLSTVQIRSRLKKIVLLHVQAYDVLPSGFLLRDVQCDIYKQYGAGAFSTVYCGTYGGRKVAVKQLRVYASSPESVKQDVKRVSRCLPAV